MRRCRVSTISMVTTLIPWKVGILLTFVGSNSASTFVKAMSNTDRNSKNKDGVLLPPLRRVLDDAEDNDTDNDESEGEKDGDTECEDMVCLNEGSCHRSVKEDGDVEEICDCLDGFMGENCEEELPKCGDVYCENGSLCSDNICNCSAIPKSNGGDVPLAYAGSSCEYRATTYCAASGSSGRGGLIQRDTFCTNQGHCKAIVQPGDPHPGCDCDVGFEGDYCEISLSELESSYTSDSAKFSFTSFRTFLQQMSFLFLGAFIFLLIIMCSIIIAVRRIQQRRRAKKLLECANFATADLMLGEQHQQKKQRSDMAIDDDDEENDNDALVLRQINHPHQKNDHHRQRNKKYTAIKKSDVAQMVEDRLGDKEII